MPEPYPDAPRDHVVEVLHGVEVADPYRALEDPDGPRTVAFVAAQNALSRPVLDALPAAAHFRAATTALLTAAQQGVPEERGGRYFVFANPGELDQQRFLVADAPDRLDAGTVLLDPNTWSADGTVALTGVALRRDGRRLAWTRSAAGSDWRTVHLLDLPEDGGAVERPDLLRGVKFADPVWLPDGDSLLYWRYPEALGTDGDAAPENGELSAALGVGELARHRTGTDQAADEVLWRPRDPDWMVEPWVSPDGHLLVLTSAPGTDSRSLVSVRPLHAGPDGSTVLGAETAVVTELADAHRVVHADGDLLYLRTERDAPTGRLVEVRLDRPDAPWRTLAVGDPDRVLADAVAVAGGFVLLWSVDTAHRLEFVDPGGTHLADLETGGLVSCTALHGRADSAEFFFGTTGYDHRHRVFRVDLTDPGRVQVLPGPGAPALHPTVAVRVRAASADGTAVPLSLVHRADLPAGPRPTLLYGYGGFDIPLTPGFSALFAAWVDAGGVLAVANLRGGGEFGRAWHEAGMLAHKQRVFDDLYGCAEHLIAAGVTTPAQLAVHGRSNGGLLVGAALTQRPELWAAALPTVGVLDMLRFHLFTIGWAWVSEYGSADDPELFPELLRYSPLHAVRPGTAYPPTLICTGDHDDRVVPAHSLKFGAALQAAQVRPFAEAPVLLRVDVRAGHGAGKPARALAAEYADQLSFAARYTGLVPRGAPDGPR